VLAVRLILAAVLLVSAGAKAMAPRRTAAAARDLGVPSALGPAVAVLLPVAEVTVAVTLIVTGTVVVGGVLATLLTAAFTAVVAGNLIRGRRPACACFGALSGHAPIGPATLVRNAVLLAASVAVLVAALLPGRCGAGCYDGAGARDVAVAGGLVAVALVGAGAVLIHALATAVGRLTARVQALEAAAGRLPSASAAGVDLPALHRAATAGTVRDPRGGVTSLAAAVGGSPSTLLLLLSADCSACERLLARIVEAPPAPGLRVVAVIDRLAHPQAGGPIEVFADGGRIATAAGVRAFPSAAVLGVGLWPVGTVLEGSTEIRRYLDDHRVAVTASMADADSPGADSAGPSDTTAARPDTSQGAWQHV
jgi:hypothetical protein